MPQRRSLGWMLVACTTVSCAGADRPAADAGSAHTRSGVSCGAAREQITVTTPEPIEGCEWVLGSLHVPDWFQSTLPFEKLRFVDDSFTLFRPHHLRDFRGLERLEEVGGEFSIQLDNAGELIALDGLASLREVGSLRIDGNPGLTSLHGLSGLETVHDGLRIVNNASLPKSEIDAFLSRIKVYGGVTIEGNAP